MAFPNQRRELASGKLLYDTPAPFVGRIRLHNPAKRNALDQELLDGLSALLEELEQLPAGALRALLVCGTEGHFCAGYDIGGVEEEDFATRAERLVAHPFTAAIDRLERFPAPTVAAIEGAALGGGLELALVCDLRLAGPAARLGMPPARLGLVYSHRGLGRFLETVGPARTKELFLRPRPLSAAQAAAWGLVGAVIEAVEEEGLALAKELAAGAPLAQRGNKRTILALLEARRALPPAVEGELLALRRASFASADLREGMAAFFERRAPQFKGR